MSSPRVVSVIIMGVKVVIVVVVDDIGDGDERSCHHSFETMLGMGVVIIIVIGPRWMGVMVVSCCPLEMACGWALLSSLDDTGMGWSSTIVR